MIGYLIGASFTQEPAVPELTPDGPRIGQWLAAMMAAEGHILHYDGYPGDDLGDDGNTTRPQCAHLEYLGRLITTRSGYGILGNPFKYDFAVVFHSGQIIEDAAANAPGSYFTLAYYQVIAEALLGQRTASPSTNGEPLADFILFVEPPPIVGRTLEPVAGTLDPSNPAHLAKWDDYVAAHRAKIAEIGGIWCRAYGDWEETLADLPGSGTPAVADYHINSSSAFRVALRIWQAVRMQLELS
jgi:hypothetical protein